MTSDVPRVLWVDDDANGLLAPLGHLLVTSGLVLDMETSFDAADERLTKTSYSAVLLDLILPYTIDRDRGGVTPHMGLTLIQAIRSGDYRLTGTQPDIPIVILSVVRHEEVADRIADLNVRYFDKTALLEPNLIDQLVGALRV